MERQKCVFFLVIINILILSSSNTLVMPFLPLYLEKSLGCTSDNLYFYTALSYSITFVISMFASPLWGKLSDKIGKKNMLLRVLVILGISYYLASICQSANQLVIARALQGLASGMTPALLAFTSTNSQSKDTGTHMGLFQSFNLIGTIVGPIIGGLIAQKLEVRDCFNVIEFFILAILVIDFIFLKEPQTKNNSAYVSSTSYKEILKSPIMQSLCSCILIHSAIIMMIVPMLLSYVIKLDGAENGNQIALSGMIFSLSGLAGAITAPLWGKFGSKRGFLRVLHFSILLGALTYTLITLTNNVYLFAIIQFFFGCCISAIPPCVHSIAAKHLNAKDHTKAYALIYSAQQLGNLSGPILCTLIMYYTSTQNVFLAISSMLLLLSIYLLYVLVINKKN